MYKDAKMEPIVAANIAPWIPPLCRGNVVNTEHNMKSKNSQANQSTLRCLIYQKKEVVKYS